jgi:leader peptidase (prepilin peptidase) / N-methyltransferase
VELHPVIYTLIFLLGLVFGSFFNVAIYRWPQEDRKKHEWVTTPSHCPKCGARIRWYDNIPLISYFLLLRGKCRDCAAPISLRYPLVELSTALLWVLTAWLVARYGISLNAPTETTYWHLAFALFFTSLYLLTVIIDFETQLIPNEISIAHFIGAWCFVGYCVYSLTPGIAPDWQSSLIGMVTLSAFFFILAYFGGMGFGDVLLALGLGVLFGWQLVIAVGFLAVLMGGTVAIILLAGMFLRRNYKKKIPIPFGPYLAISAYICLFAGHQLVSWYLGLFGLGGLGSPATGGG